MSASGPKPTSTSKHLASLHAPSRTSFLVLAFRFSLGLLPGLVHYPSILILRSQTLPHMRTKHTAHPLPAFPVYSAAFVTPTEFVLGGGGGQSKTGIKNKLVCVHSTSSSRRFSGEICASVCIMLKATRK